MNVEDLMRRLAQAQSDKDAIAAKMDALTATNVTLSTQVSELESKLQISEAKNQLHENEIDVLLQRIRSLTRRLAEATSADAQLALRFELNQAQRQLDRRNAELYSKSSERRPNKPDNDDNPDEAEKPEDSSEGKKKKGRTKQPELPIIEEVHELDDADQCCPKCGRPLTEWGEHFEESEEITVVQRRYKILRHKRQKYKCSSNDCQHIETALGPTKLIPGGRYSTDFAIHVAINKYIDHLPLARQVKRMMRAGLKVTRTTLWDQLTYLYVLLMPTLVALHDDVLDNDFIHADETSWPVIRPQKTKKWWVWSARSSDAVYFRIIASRGREAARSLLQNFDGLLMADDYTVYSSLEQERSRHGVQRIIVDGIVIDKPTPDYRLATCWAHIRRYFFKAAKSGDSRAEQALDLIGALYAVEKDLECQAQDFAALLELRRQHRPSRSAPLVDQLVAWCQEVSTLEGTDLHRAVTHFLRIEQPARLFLAEPVVPLDNNPMEREIRQVVMGRKNFYGARSEEGSRVAAMFYSLFATCSIIGVDPRAYLSYAVHTVLETDATVVLPHDFKRVVDARTADGSVVEQDTS